MRTYLLVLSTILVWIISASTVSLKPTTTLTADLKSQMAKAELSILNHQRSLHGVPSVQLNSTLTNAAQAYADKLCATKIFAHSPEAHDGKYGQNLYTAAAYPAINYTDGKATLSWYSEIDNYDFSTGQSTNGLPVGHFTAEIWKAVTTAGFGYCLTTIDYSSFKLAKMYVVANYYPVPNFYYVGKKQEAYVENVPKPL